MNVTTFASPPLVLPNGSSFLVREIAHGRLTPDAIRSAGYAVYMIEAGFLVEGVALLADTPRVDSDVQAIARVADGMGLGEPLEVARAVIHHGAPGAEHHWIPLTKRSVHEITTWRCTRCRMETQQTDLHSQGCPADAIREAIRRANQEETDR